MSVYHEQAKNAMQAAYSTLGEAQQALNRLSTEATTVEQRSRDYCNGELLQAAMKIIWAIALQVTNRS